MNIEDKAKSARPHNIILEDRKKLSISGVEDVESFDDCQIILLTNQGSLIIRGSELHIDALSLDAGELAVTGLVTDLGYEETVRSGSLWQRLFK